MSPKRLEKELKKPKKDRFGGPVGLLFVAFWGAFSTPRCRRSCPCCCLLWCSVFCMLEFCSFVCCCCGGFGSPWLLVLRSCFWVFLRSAEQATNRLEPKRGRRQGRSRKIFSRTIRPSCRPDLYPQPPYARRATSATVTSPKLRRIRSPPKTRTAPTLHEAVDISAPKTCRTTV